jgi:hypothetical protein
MEYYAFPNTIYDQPENLLAVLGSWWARDYASFDQVSSLVRGKAQVERQTLLDIMELIASISRFSVPIYHKDNWYPLYVRESELNGVNTSLPTYDGSNVYADGEWSFGTPLGDDKFAFPVADNLISAPVIMNRFTDPTLLMTEQVDYLVAAGTIVFKMNPFADVRVAKRPVFEDGVVVDQEALLWVWRGEWDWDTIYRQFGYVLRMRLQSSKGYRDLMNAVYDGITGGTSRSDILSAFSAMTGVPLVREAEETVEHVTSDGTELLIITDQQVYKFGLNAVPIVAVGDVLKRGDSLTDALQVHELNCGETPEDLHALALGEGFLSTCFFSDLIFENKNVPLEVEPHHPSGYTKVSWGLGGFPLDVDKFFDELHNRGVAKAQQPVDDCEASQVVRYPGSECGEVEFVGRRATLAHLLDRRTEPIGEPQKDNLPQVINPLKFLVENVLRNNAYIVRVKVSSAGSGGVGLHNVKLLRQVVPPHTAMLLLVDLTAKEDSVTVDNLEEQVTTFVGMEPLEDEVTDDLVEDCGPTIRVISGTCF